MRENKEKFAEGYFRCRKLLDAAFARVVLVANSLVRGARSASTRAASIRREPRLQDALRSGRAGRHSRAAQVKGGDARAALSFDGRNAPRGGISGRRLPANRSNAMLTVS